MVGLGDEEFWHIELSGGCKGLVTTRQQYCLVAPMILVVEYI